MSYLRNLSLAGRIYRLSGTVVLALLLVIGWLLLDWRERLYDSRRHEIQILVESSWHILDFHARQEASGNLSPEAARRQALDQVRGLRFEAGNYFWVMDQSQRVVMHPLRPDLDGLDTAASSDAEIIIPAKAMTEVAARDGEGFIEYRWPRPGASEPVRKVAFVKTFSPWGWVIGTGYYVDDIDRLFTRLLIGTGLVLSIVIAGALLLVSRVARSISVPAGKAVAMIEALERGDLGHRLRLQQTDEVGRLAKALDAFADNLQYEILTAFDHLAKGDFSFEARGLIREPLARTNSLLKDLVANLEAAMRTAREEKAKTEATFAAIGDGVVIFDAGSKVTYQNPIHLKLVGNHLGESCRAAYLDGGHDCTDCAVARVRAEGTVQRKERRILVDGQAVFLETTAAPIRNAGGEIVSVIEIVRDISERRRAEEALRESEARYSSLFQNNHATMLLVDPATGEIVDANPAAAEFYGYSRDRLIGKNISEINSLSEEEILQEMQKARQDRRRQFYFRHRLASGEVRDIEVFSGPIQVQGRELLFSLIHDVTERKMAEDRVQYQAFHDALTGLPNRALLEDRLQQTLVRAVRHAEPGAIFFLDLDRFKVINDSLGHHAGDQLLVGVGEGLTATLRTGDTVCRHGGDEFILLLPQVKNAADAAHVAEKIQKLFSRHFSVAGREIFVSPSIGISLYPADGSDIPTLIKNADAAMYLAKERGRNNYQFFKPELTIAMHERLALENDLRQALAKNELLLHYQPQIDTATQKLVGVEALVRWQHPRLGLVMPDRFIPIAEETGLIEQLGEWVLRTACAQGKVWQESGFVPLRIAVNVSSRQFGQPDFPAVVGRVLEEAGLDSRWLELEVTENIIMEHVEKTVAILADLKRRGISLAIDDFGTGYSSLNYLRQFPIDRLKIDRSFIADITTNPDDAAIASAVISLAKSLNLAVVAEGVETTEQVQFLLERGCDEIQGYLFARPAPAEALLPYMEPQKDSKNRVLAAQGQEGGRAFGWN